MVRNRGRGQTKFGGIADNHEFAQTGDDRSGVARNSMVPDAIE